MKKERFYQIIIFALLALNIIGALFIFMGGRRGHPPGDYIAGAIIKELGLDDAQKETFEKLKRAHHAQILDLNQAYSQGLDTYLQQLKQSSIEPSVSDSLASALASIQKQKAEITLKHFGEVKALCRPDQLPAFEKLLPQLMQVILPPPGRKEDMRPSVHPR